MLYAKFTRKSYVVDFFGEDGSILDSQTVYYGDSATAPEAPVVNGKTFVGWSEDFSRVTSSLSVYALYDEVAKFTVKFASLGTYFWEYEFVAGTPTDIVPVPVDTTEPVMTIAQLEVKAIVYTQGINGGKGEWDGTLEFSLSEEYKKYQI